MAERILPSLGRTGETLTINQATNEVIGTTSGKVYATGSSLAEALALQTQLQSGGTPTVSGRPDLYAVAPTATEEQKPITGASGQAVQPTVATASQLQQASAGTLESFNQATTILTPEQQAVKFAEQLKVTVGSGVEAGRESLISTPSESYDQLLIAQKAALNAWLLSEQLTPEDLRWLSPVQQEAIRSAKKQNVQAQVTAINYILNGRQELKDKEDAEKEKAETKAWARIETLQNLGLLATMPDTELQSMADAVGLTVEQLKMIPANVAGQSGKTVTRTDTDPTTGQEYTQIINIETGEILYDSRSYEEDRTSIPLTAQSGYGGQCGDYLHTILDIPQVGDSFESKMNVTDPSITAENAQIGDVFVQNIGQYGHIGAINGISIDPKTGERVFTVTESNYNLDEMITTNRKVKASEIQGYGRYERLSSTQMNDYDWGKELITSNPNASDEELELSLRENTKLTDGDITSLLENRGTITEGSESDIDLEETAQYLYDTFSHSEAIDQIESYDLTEEEREELLNLYKEKRSLFQWLLPGGK